MKLMVERLDIEKLQESGLELENARGKRVYMERLERSRLGMKKVGLLDWTWRRRGKGVDMEEVREESLGMEKARGRREDMRKGRGGRVDTEKMEAFRPVPSPC